MADKVLICADCDNEQWVCKNHPEVPWGGGDGCCGGAGMICKCHPSYEYQEQMKKEDAGK